MAAGLLAGALLLLQPPAVHAQTVWDMATEYPQSAMPGLGVTTFTRHVGEFSAGKLRIKPSFDAAAGIRSAGMLAAIAAGRVQAGDAFAGALGTEDPIFALAASAASSGSTCRISVKSPIRCRCRSRASIRRAMMA